MPRWVLWLLVAVAVMLLFMNPRGFALFLKEAFGSVMVFFGELF